MGELVGDATPTNQHQRNHRQRLQIDGFVVSDPWRDRIVPGSVCVQPDFDHLAVRVAIKV